MLIFSKIKKNDTLILHITNYVLKLSLKFNDVVRAYYCIYMFCIIEFNIIKLLVNYMLIIC